MDPQVIKVHFKHPNLEVDYILLNEFDGTINSSKIFGIDAGDHLLYYDKFDLRDLSYEVIKDKIKGIKEKTPVSILVLKAGSPSELLRKGCELPNPSKAIGFCPQCPFRKSAWDHDTYKLAQAFRQHVKSSTHSNYGLGKYFWNCDKCGKSYNRSEQFENHPCERLKRRESDEPAVKYVRKDNQKKIHREAKIWSSSVMYDVAFEEKWCFQGN